MKLSQEAIDSMIIFELDIYTGLWAKQKEKEAEERKNNPSKSIIDAFPQ